MGGAVTAICLAKDEADVIEQTVSRMVSQVDRVLVADNGSTDGTREILERLPVVVIDDPEVGYFQSRKMSALAARAAEEGADWVVPFDADEIWCARTHVPFRAALTGLPGHVLVAQADLYDHVATVQDSPDDDPIVRMGWRRRSPAPLPKVACRIRGGLTVEQGNHSVTYPDQDLPATISNLLTIRHFPYRSAEQMIRKARNGAAAYAATDLPEEIGAHWRGYGQLSDEQIAGVFHEYFWSENPEADGLVRDPCP